MPIVGGIETSELQSLIRKTVQDQIVAIEATVDGLGHTIHAFDTKLNGLGKLVETKASEDSLLCLQESVKESLNRLQEQEVADFGSVQSSLQTYSESVQASLNSLQAQFNHLQAQQLKDCGSLKESFKESHNQILAQEVAVGGLQSSLESQAQSVTASIQSLQQQETKDFELLQTALSGLQTSSQQSIDTLSEELAKLRNALASDSEMLATLQSEMGVKLAAKADKTDTNKTDNRLRKLAERMKDCEVSSQQSAVLDDKDSKDGTEYASRRQSYIVTAEGNNLSHQAGSAATFESMNISKVLFQEPAMTNGTDVPASFKLRRESSPDAVTQAPSISMVTAVDEKTGLTYTGVDSTGSGIPDSLEEVRIRNVQRSPSPESSHVTRQSSMASAATFVVGLDAVRSPPEGHVAFGAAVAGLGVAPAAFPSSTPSYEPHQIRRSFSTPLVSAKGGFGISPSQQPVPRTAVQQMSPSPQLLLNGRPSPLATPFNFVAKGGSATYPPAANWPGPLLTARDKLRQHNS